jgi:hypothetical protein
MQPDSDRDDSTRSSRSSPTRSFVRAFVAASYLLGKRRQALSSHVAVQDPVAREALLEITEQLSHPTQERRARVLAGEVGRLIRSLGAQRIK